MNEFQIILEWLSYNLTWLQTNWPALLNLWAQIIAVASAAAALFPNKNESTFVNKVHNYVNTDKIHSVIDFFAFTFLNASKGTKANQQAIVPPTVKV